LGASAFLPADVRWNTCWWSGNRTNTSSVPITSGVRAIRPSVRVSKRRCMKYRATSAAFATAIDTRRMPIRSFAIGRKITPISMTVRMARYQKIAM
jgi:hypothetical protein